MVQDNMQYGFDIPLVTPAFNYVKRLLNDFEQGVRGVTSLPGQVSTTIGKTGSAIPIVLGVLAVGVAGYFLLAGKKGTKLTP